MKNYNTAFVTGADGFIGSHLVEFLLKKNFKVYALSFYNSFGSVGWLEMINHRNLIIIKGDIREKNLYEKIVQKCDYIFHLASLISIPYSYLAYKSYIDTNVNGLICLLETASASKKIKKIIVTSTSEIYGTAQYVPINESHPISSQSPYAASKASADQISLSFAKSYNLPITILRPFNTFGPRQSYRAVIPSIINQFINFNGQIKIGETLSTRDFTYVEDLVRCFYILSQTKKNVIGEVFNVGSGFEISIKDLISLVAQISNKKKYDIITDKSKIRPKKSEVFRLLCDNKKVKKTIGWKPSSNNLDSFLKPLSKTYNWINNNNFNLNKIDNL